MKFRLREGEGQSAIREIGSYLRNYGSRCHWIEKFRGDVYVHPGDGEDANILINKFHQLVEPIADEDDD